MSTTRDFLCTALLSGAALLACGPNLRAQVDPAEAVRKIVDQVNEEMRAIDRLLLESSRQDNARGGGAEAERLRGLIDQTKDSQGNVVRGIDQLIDELQNMAQQQQQQQQQGQGQPQDQQQGQGQPQPRDGQEQQPGEGQRQSGTRRETNTPDMVQQPGQNRPAGDQPQPGEEPRQGDVAADGPEQRSPGQNRQSGSATEGGTEEVQRGADAEPWGELQKYVPPQYQRAGAPEVPAKYRRLHEAFQKRPHKRSGGR